METVSKWAFQSKMLFSLDPIKQAIEFCFSHKGGKVVYPPLMFNNNDVRSVSSQKHLWLVLASKLRFNEYLNNKIKKYNKSMDIMKEIFLILSRNFRQFIKPFSVLLRQYSIWQTSHWVL